MRERKLERPSEYLRAYPRICAHIICHSLGYATPTCAATILMQAHRGEPDYCEWIDACYHGDPQPAVKQSIKNRHSHHGYMAEYKLARAIVDRAINSGDEPVFASWF